MPSPSKTTAVILLMFFSIQTSALPVPETITRRARRKSKLDKLIGWGDKIQYTAANCLRGSIGKRHCIPTPIEYQTQYNLPLIGPFFAECVEDSDAKGPIKWVAGGRQCMQEYVASSDALVKSYISRIAEQYARTGRMARSAALSTGLSVSGFHSSIKCHWDLNIWQIHHQLGTLTHSSLNFGPKTWVYMNLSRLHWG